MIGKLILTHGGLARELLSAAQVISGRLSGFEAISLDWNEGVEEVKARVEAALQRLEQGQGVLILTDMYGGTPCNVAAGFFSPGKVEILTGVNLPMVLRLACQSMDEGALSDVARWLQAKSQRSLCLVGDMVQPPKCAETALAAPVEKKVD